MKQGHILATVFALNPKYISIPRTPNIPLFHGYTKVYYIHTGYEGVSRVQWLDALHTSNAYPRTPNIPTYHRAILLRIYPRTTYIRVYPGYTLIRRTTTFNTPQNHSIPMTTVFCLYAFDEQCLGCRLRAIGQ